jgi:multiple sugar transport system permease protein
MVMFIAGPQNIPMEYHESAMIDGASWLRRLFSITIPLLRATVVLVIVTCIIFVFGQFAIPFVISQGGPNYSTELLTLFIYRNAFGYLKVGFASAASVFYFLTMLFFSVVQIRIFQGKDER